MSKEKDFRMNMPKFDFKNPSSKEEKLIAELIKDLDETTNVFMRLNNFHNKAITQEIFIILRDASIGYTGGMLRDLIKMLADKKQIQPFIEEAERIYKCYINEIRNNLLND